MSTVEEHHSGLVRCNSPNSHIDLPKTQPTCRTRYWPGCNTWETPANSRHTMRICRKIQHPQRAPSNLRPKQDHVHSHSNAMPYLVARAFSSISNKTYIVPTTRSTLFWNTGGIYVNSVGLSSSTMKGMSVHGFLSCSCTTQHENILPTYLPAYLPALKSNEPDSCLEHQHPETLPARYYSLHIYSCIHGLTTESGVGDSLHPQATVNCP